MDTSRSKGKSPGDPVPAKAAATAAFWIRLHAKEDSRPFAVRMDSKTSPAHKRSNEPKSKVTDSQSECELNERGKALLACWRELGRLRPGIQPDACAIGPHEFRGILMLAPDGAEPPTLSEAVRLFKVMAALRLSQLEKGAALPRNTQVTVTRRSEAPNAANRLPSALWQKGYAERPLATAQEISAARKALK